MPKFDNIKDCPYIVYIGCYSCEWCTHPNKPEEFDEESFKNGAPTNCPIEVKKIRGIKKRRKYGYTRNIRRV